MKITEIKMPLPSDFQKVMEKVSNKDLGQFFKQWLYVARSA